MKSENYFVYSAIEHSDYYSPCDIPDKMLEKVGGHVIMSDCQPYVCFFETVSNFMF